MKHTLCNIDRKICLITIKQVVNGIGLIVLFIEELPGYVFNIINEFVA